MGQNVDQLMSATGCELEPIHSPGSIQPYGIMLIANARDLTIAGYAGSFPAGSLDPIGRVLTDVVKSRVPIETALLPAKGVRIIGTVDLAGRDMDAVAFRTGDHLVLELTEQSELSGLDVGFLAEVDQIGDALDQADSFPDLFNEAARIFRDLTGYDRAMIYRFVDDDAGMVVGEARSDAVASFMNHHFPASDIPRQARELYVRNRVRVIADVHYEPAPIVGTGLSAIDLGDSTLRSVSPVHIQYLKNMGVAASASMSIVKDGKLWGLVACHHHEPRSLSLGIRLASQTFASSLSRRVKAREEGDLYRERIRLRSREESVLKRLGPDHGLEDFFERSGKDLARLLKADGFAAVQGHELFVFGRCPAEEGVRDIAEYVRKRALHIPYATSQLSKEFPGASRYAEEASGILAVTMSTEVPTILLWFREEYLQTVQWAGNPHEDAPSVPGEVLRPRASFEAWTESVRGRSREWTHAEEESAGRMVKLMLDARTNWRIQRLVEELQATVRENEILLNQKDFLLKEVNHRVRNSLTLVSAFLRMQANEATVEAKTQLTEAMQRVTAVSLVHKRLYRDDSVKVVDLSYYLSELCDELIAGLGKAWQSQITTEFAPVLVATDHAVSIGLILNELVTNALKYAYKGQPGPVTISLKEHRELFRLTVVDRGIGRQGPTKGSGFGIRMVNALMHSLHGTLDYIDNEPGVRAVLEAPLRNIQ